MGLFQKWFSPESSPRKMAAAQEEQQIATDRMEEQARKAEQNLADIRAQEMARLRARGGGFRALMADASIEDPRILGKVGKLGANV